MSRCMSPSPRGGNSPPELVEALALLRSLSCIIDGGAVCCDDDGIPSFDRIRYRRYDASVPTATTSVATRWR